MWVEKLCKTILDHLIASSSLWGCELKKLGDDNSEEQKGHPPCEDVSWKYRKQMLPRKQWVILLVRMWVEKSPCHSPLLMHLSSSLWGCELKTFWLASETLIHTSSSLWGCELKSFQIFYICISLRHPPCEDVSWKSKAPTVLVSLSGHPPCEDVSWKMW